MSAFQPQQQVRAQVDETLATIKRLPRSGTGEILYPGERGARTFAQRSAQGIPLPDATWKNLVKQAQKLGVALAPLAA